MFRAKLLVVAFATACLVAYLIVYGKAPAIDRPAAEVEVGVDRVVPPPAAVRAPETGTRPPVEPTPEPKRPSGSSPGSGSTDGVPPRAAGKVIAGFVDGWLSRDPGRRRAAVLRRYAIEDLVSGLLLTDPANLPRRGTARSGPAELVDSTPVSGTFSQSLTDGSALLLEVAHVGGGRWRVTSVLPASESVVS
ncbi:MAG: hypothetical protein ACRCYQ_10615 [Nocardioides sp.]